MLSGGNVIYLYDGTFEGLMCCVYEHYYNKTTPLEIKKQSEQSISFFENVHIETDSAIANRVYNSIDVTISKRAQNLVKTAFLSCMKDKEIAILNFLKYGYKCGKKTMLMISHPCVCTLLDAEKHLLKEAHNFKGFVRFEDYNGALVAKIAPKNFVLPFLKNHFCSRFPNENFLIFDESNKCALVYKEKNAQIINLDSLLLPKIDETEQKYRQMWRAFYETIAIKERENPRCQMTFMPKRYWANLTEKQNDENEQVQSLNLLKP